MSCQHIGNCKEGIKVWFQEKDSNAWFRPALVLCQGGQRVWLHRVGDIKNMASCKVKPYELVKRKVPDSD